MRHPTEGDVRDEPPIDPTAAGSSAGSLTRRQVLAAGAGAGMAFAALDAAPAVADSWTDPLSGRGPRWELSFDEDWRFYRGDTTGAQATSFDDSGWRQLDVPHDWRIEDLPYATSDDGGATADPSTLGFQTQPSPDGTAPSVIGPFDQNADPVPDLDLTIPGFGTVIFPGGRSQGYTVAGIGWYRKHFTLPDLDRQGNGGGNARRVELRFDGVYGRTDVWLNGTHLGFHPNGYTSFAYDLTPYLTPRGQNVLAVRIDNTGKTSRWYSGSGIYRHTWLTVTAPVRVPLWGVTVTTPVVNESGSVAHVEVQVTNFGTPARASVRMTVLDPRGRPAAVQTTPVQTLQSGSTETYAADLAVSGAALWSPEAPNLYQVRTEVLVDGRAVDAVASTFGIRSLVFNGTVGFLLNGKPYKVLGGNLHHDHGPLGTVAIDRAEERSIEILKAAGFNAIRASHNPRSPYMLDVCDRLGMLVWNEFTDMWDVAKTKDDYSNYFAEWWQTDLTSMVVRDRNHPSVIIWSIGNEISTDPNNYGPRLAALVHSLDTTRPVSLGGMNLLNGSDPWQYVDVGDFHGAPSTAAADHAAHPDKAISESEDTAASSVYADWTLATGDNPYFVGTWVWSGWDYLGESGIGAPVVASSPAQAAELGFNGALGQVLYPWFVGFSGDIDLIGQRKPQNFYRAVVNGRSPLEVMVARPTPPGTQQYVEDYSYYDELPSWTWDVAQGQAMTVHVYTSGDSITLLLNGKQVAAQTLTDANQRVATFSVPYAPGELTAIASQNGGQIASTTLATTGQPAAIRLTPDVNSLSTSRDDLAHVLAEVVDSRGRKVPDAVVNISFQVNGAGQLAGAGNGNPHNVDSFQRPSHWTWHGQALAVLRPAKTPGALTLAATAQGLQSARLTLRVSPTDPEAYYYNALRRRPRIAASFAAPGLMFGLGAAVIKRRMHNAESDSTDASTGTEQ
jgi:beta-galactosidase